MSIYVLIISAAIIAAFLITTGSAIYIIGKAKGYVQACEDILFDLEKQKHLLKTAKEKAEERENACNTIK